MGRGADLACGETDTRGTEKDCGCGFYSHSLQDESSPRIYNECMANPWPDVSLTC